MSDVLSGPQIFFSFFVWHSMIASEVAMVRAIISSIRVCIRFKDFETHFPVGWICLRRMRRHGQP